jgi:hypothetical protein
MPAEGFGGVGAPKKLVREKQDASPMPLGVVREPERASGPEFLSLSVFLCWFPEFVQPYQGLCCHSSFRSAQDEGHRARNAVAVRHRPACTRGRRVAATDVPKGRKDIHRHLSGLGPAGALGKTNDKTAPNPGRTPAGPVSEHISPECSGIRLQSWSISLQSAPTPAGPVSEHISLIDDFRRNSLVW